MGVAAAAPEVCAPVEASRDTLAVAWVSPVRERAGRTEWIEVVEAAGLRGWVAKRKQPSVGELLALLDLRHRDGEPKRRYKVVIFEVRAEDLCATGESAGDLPVWTVEWRTAAQGGFCLLPADRFVRETAPR